MSGAWKQFTTLAGAAWANLRSQEAGVWNTYQTLTLQDWQAMVNQITDAAKDVVDNLAPEYITRINNIAIGLHGYWDAMADALKFRNQTTSTAVSNRSQQANTQIRLSSDTIIGYACTHDDEVANDTHDSITSVLGTGLQFITDMVTNSLPFEQTLTGAVGGIYSNVRSLTNTQSLADLLSLKTVFQVATTTDDAIFPAWANLQTKQSTLSTVIQRDAAVNTSVIQLAYSFVSRVYPTFNYAASIFQNDAGYSSIRQLLVGQFLANPMLAQAVGQQQQQPIIRPQLSPDGYRTLTGTETSFLLYVFRSALPGIVRSEHLNDSLSSTLGKTVLRDAGAQQDWWWYKNVIAQNAFARNPNVQGITIGTDQFYPPGILPHRDSPSTIAVIAHEAAHSFHCEAMSLGTPAFLSAYVIDSAAAHVYEGNGYEKNLSEVLGHAIEDTVVDVLQKYPHVLSSFNAASPNYGQIPEGLRSFIAQSFERNFFLHFSQGSGQ